jgi:hypothetical protein
MFSQQLTDEIAVYDVTPNELMPRVASYAIEIVQVPRIGEFVEIDNGSFSVLHPLQDEVRPDESRAAGDENSISHSKCRCMQGPELLLLLQDRTLIVIKKDGLDPSST